MRNALRTLPWVEESTIRMDFNTRALRFGVKDKDQFNEEDVKKTLRAQGFADADLLVGFSEPDS